jgi:uncharacterized protein
MVYIRWMMWKKIRTLGLFLSGVSLYHTVDGQNGLLWRISGKEHISFVYGTMHTSDTIANSMDSTVWNALFQCETLLLEADLAELPDPYMMSQMIIMPDRELKDLYTAEEMAEINAFLETRLPVMGQLMKDKLYPIFVMFLLEQAQLLERLSQDKEELLSAAMDMQFQHKADEHGMGSYGLESWKEQMQSVVEIPIQLQAQLLLETARGKDFYEVMKYDVEKYYFEQDLTSMIAMMNDTKETERAFFDAILFSRNDRFVNRALPHLEASSTFIAVGALHLAGARGILQQFREQGFQVEQVPFSFLKYHPEVKK